MIVGDIDGYQTRFRAWLRFLGAQPGDIVLVREYVLWIMHKSSEFAQAHGMTLMPNTPEMHHEFTDWLYGLEPASSDDVKGMVSGLISAIEYWAGAGFDTQETDGFEKMRASLIKFQAIY